MVWWVPFLWFVGTTVVAELLRPKPKFATPRPSALGDFQIPTAQEGRPIQLIFGRCHVQGVNCTWYGDLKVVPITEKVKTGLFSSKRITKGYKYYLGMQLGLGHGVIDAVNEIRFGDKVIVPSVVTPSAPNYTTYTFNSPELFGGEDKEGGVTGLMDFYFGTTTQLGNSYLQSATGKAQPGYRTLCHAVLKQMYIGTSQYIKTVSFVLDKYPNALGIGSNKHKIGDDANPICALYEILTHTLWGCGFTGANLDTTSFLAAAETCYAEGLGVSFMIDNIQSADDAQREILRHVDGTMYTDPSTGLITVKLGRLDYDVNTLLVLDESNSDEAEFSRGSWEETINSIRVKYTDRVANFNERYVPFQNQANIQTRGGWIETEEYDFTMFSNAATATKVAARVSKTVSYPLARASVIANRVAYPLRPGSVVKYTQAQHGISNLVCRVTNIDYGQIRQGKIRLDLVEDIFNVAFAAYSPPVDSEWTPPTLNAAQIAAVLDLEVPYYIIKNTFDEGALAAIPSTDSFALILAKSPGGQNLSFNVYDSLTNVTADFNKIGNDLYTPTAQLNGAIAWDTTNWNIDTISGEIDEVVVGSLAWLNGEWVQITALNFGAGTMSVKRGVLDSVPPALGHVDNSVIWFYGGVNGFAAFDAPFTRGVTRYYRETGIGVLGETDLATAPQQAHLHAGDWYKPYPPADVKVFDAYFPASIPSNFKVTWKGRNRLTQGIVGWTEAHAAIESGTTYTLRIYNGITLDLIVELTGLTVTSTGGQYTYSGDTSGATSYKIELWSVRSGFASRQKFTHTATLFGYGLDYGNNYGGSVLGVVLPRGISNINLGDQYTYVPSPSWINGAWRDVESKAPLLSLDDGLNWLAEAQPNLFTVAPGMMTWDFLYDFGNGYYVATNRSGWYYRRRDGGLWEGVPLTAITSAGGNIQSIIYDGTKFVMLTANGYRIFTSTDLTTWTLVGGDPNNLRNSALTQGCTVIVKIGANYVAFGAIDTIMHVATSTDLITWTLQPAVDSEVWGFFGNGVFFNGAYFAFGVSGTGDAAILKVMRSVNGITWTAVATPASSGTGGMREVVVLATKMQVVAGNRVFNTTNGTTWTDAGYTRWSPNVLAQFKGKLARFSQELGPTRLLCRIPYYTENGGKIIAIDGFDDSSPTLVYPAGAPYAGKVGAIDLFHTNNSKIFYPYFDNSGFRGENVRVDGHGGKVGRLQLSGKKYFEVLVEAWGIGAGPGGGAALWVGAGPLTLNALNVPDPPVIFGNFHSYTPVIGDLIGVLSNHTDGVVEIRVNNVPFKTVTGLNNAEPWVVTFIPAHTLLYINLGQDTFVYTQPGYSAWDT